MSNNLQSYGTIEEKIAEKLAKKEQFGPLYKYDSINKLQSAIDGYFNMLELYNNPDDVPDELAAELIEAGMPTKKKPNKPKIPSLPGLAEYLGTTTFKLRDYMANEEYKEIIESAIQKMEVIVTDMGMSGLINVNWLKFYMKNIHLREEQSTVKTITEKKEDVGIYVIQPTLRQKIEDAKEIDLIEMSDEKPQTIKADDLSEEENELFDGFG